MPTRRGMLGTVATVPVQTPVTPVASTSHPRASAPRTTRRSRDAIRAIPALATIVKPARPVRATTEPSASATRTSGSKSEGNRATSRATVGTARPACTASIGPSPRIREVSSARSCVFSRAAGAATTRPSVRTHSPTGGSMASDSARTGVIRQSPARVRETQTVSPIRTTPRRRVSPSFDASRWSVRPISPRVIRANAPRCRTRGAVPASSALRFAPIAREICVSNPAKKTKSVSTNGASIPGHPGASRTVIFSWDDLNRRRLRPLQFSP